VLPPAGAQGFEASPPVVRWKRDTENVADFTIKVRYPALGMIDSADDDVAQSAQAFGEKP
jgi:hypothetical protein